jgi:hypothetical protein
MRIPKMYRGRRKIAKHPHWDKTMRVLSIGRTAIKVFRQPARNQVLILETFEELGWPERIDDPLPTNGRTSPKRRVHDAINRLNRNQIKNLIRFYGDGTGTAFCWEMR